MKKLSKTEAQNQKHIDEARSTLSLIALISNFTSEERTHFANAKFAQLIFRSEGEITAIDTEKWLKAAGSLGAEQTYADSGVDLHSKPERIEI